VTGDQERSVALVGGHSRQGDDGGGVFLWDPGVGVDDGGTVVVPGGDVGTAAKAGCWRRLLSGPFNVKWFGAAGDGATDDTSPINAAIRAASSRQATLFFPPGTYMVSAGLRASSRLRIQGSGPQWSDRDAGSCIRASRTLPYLLQIAAPDICIDFMWLDGNYLAENVVELRYPADNCDYTRLLITRAMPMTQGDVTKSNLVAVAAGSTIGIGAQTFRACKLIQDPFGDGGVERSKRGHACVSNYFPGVGAGGSPNAFHWLFDGHCFFTGQQYVYRTKFGGATFANSEFFDIGTALFAVELNQPILVLDCYTEEGLGSHGAAPHILLQEEQIAGLPGMAAGELNFTHCQFNTPGAGFVLNGKGPVRIDDCTINGDVSIVPSPRGGSAMPISVVGCGFGPERGIRDPQGYPHLTQFGNFTVRGGAVRSSVHPPRIAGSTVGAGLRGVVVIKDPATTTRVTFESPRPTGNYHVLLSLGNVSRPSAIRTPYTYDLEASGFKIGLSGGMGPGQSCSVFWQVGD
jgi:hypothetical protein